MAVVVDEAENQKGLVFLMHGFIGFKEHPLLLETAKIFKEKGFTTVSFDATHAFGESEGKMEQGTMTGYLEDLEDVIEWSKDQRWYDKKFFMVGHSLGGYCVSLYATKDRNVRGLILFSPLVSGELYLATDDIRSIMNEWIMKGMREWVSGSSGGLVKRSGYAFVKDSLKHDLLKVAREIRCPVLMITGDEDEVIPMNDQKMLFEKIKSKKEMHIIEGGNHNLTRKEKSKELINIVKNWIENNFKYNNVGFNKF